MSKVKFNIKSNKNKNIVLNENNKKHHKRHNSVSITESTEVHTTFKQPGQRKLSIFSIDNTLNVQNDNRGENFRHDAYGNLIFKGGKTHRVSFIDVVSNQQIAEMIVMSNEDNKKEKVAKQRCVCSASCILF